LNKIIVYIYYLLSENKWSFKGGGVLREISYEENFLWEEQFQEEFFKAKFYTEEGGGENLLA